LKFNIVVKNENEVSTFDLENTSISIGRSSDNDIQLNDKHASRHHLKLWGEDNRILAKDLGSENGTYVNGRQIPPDKVVELGKGHSILVGKSLISLLKGKSENVFVFLQPDDTLFQRLSPQ